MTPIDLKGQRSKVKVTMAYIRDWACERDTDHTVSYIFLKLGSLVTLGDMISLIDFQGQRSKVKATLVWYVFLKLLLHGMWIVRERCTLTYAI